jgi:hypothetical protein
VLHLHTFLILAVDGGGSQFYVSVAALCGKILPVSVYCEAGWAAEWSACCGVGKNLVPIYGIVEQLPGC